MRRTKSGFAFDKRGRRKPDNWDKQNLLKPGINPKTVVDIGVDNGTPYLYDAFESSFFVLIEPLKECEEDMKDILTKYKGKYFITACGDEDTKTTIYIDPIKQGRSSIDKPTVREMPKTTEAREIDVKKLDTILVENPDLFQAPYGLKIDTEGFELNVIKGAKEFLKQTQFVIAETNVMPRHENSYTFHEFVNAMNDEGFELVDILNRGKGEIYLNWMDAYFIRKELIQK